MAVYDVREVVCPPRQLASCVTLTALFLFSVVGVLHTTRRQGRRITGEGCTLDFAVPSSRCDKLAKQAYHRNRRC